MNERAASTESARARAQQLLHRASMITVTTTTKLTQLQAMADTYHYNEIALNNLKSRVDELNHEIIGYLERIQERSDYYRQCTS